MPSLARQDDQKLANGNGGGAEAADVVEALGAGRAQFWIMALGAGGVFWAEGTVLAIINMSTRSLKKDFNLGDEEESILTTVAFFNMLVGVIVAGNFADSAGRRLPTVACLLLVGVSCALAACMRSYTGVVVFASVAVFGIGMGMSPSMAMLSENTPAASRMLMRSLTNLCYPGGMVVFTVIAGFDDAWYFYLHWRMLLVLCSAPALVLALASAVMLPESPVYLAMVGKRLDAQKGFKQLAHWNGLPVGRLPALRAAGAEGPGARGALSVMQQFGVVLSGPYFFQTLVLVVACFCCNLTLYGSLYAGPIVLQTTASLAPAWQGVLNAIPGIVASLAAPWFFARVSRKTGLLLAMAMLVSTTVAFTWAAQRPMPRSMVEEAFFQYANLGGSFSLSLCFIPIYQLSVEAYPTTAAATAGSVIIGVGRLGAIAAPSLFERVRLSFGWPYFYVFLSILNAISLVMLGMLLPSTSGPPSADAEIHKVQAGGESYGAAVVGKGQGDGEC